MTKSRVRVPEIVARNGVPAVKQETKFRVKGAPVVSGPSGEFLPRGAVLSVWPMENGRAHVKLVGDLAGGGYRPFLGQKMFNVKGCSYAPAPEWLRTLLVEAGYTGEFDG